MDSGGESDSGVGQWVGYVLTGVYLYMVWAGQSGARPGVKAWLSFHGGRVAEKVTAAAWDTTLKLRRYYRSETEV